ncbi:hypothetical protein M2426_000538 [Pseudomonas moraviensis]|uniref:hypothetical protein n=1 Tax=Pseudomonas moraviensis TaxID=321662 RepID=UPI003D218300
MEDFDKNVDPQTESVSSSQMNEGKAQILQIDFPPPNALLGSKVIVRGRAVPQNPSQEVVVEVNRTLYPPRDGNGYWYVEDDLESLPYPNLNIAARIRDPVQRVSVDIIWRKNCGTSITSPAAGAFVPPAQPFLLKGDAITGSTVTVKNVATGQTLGTCVAGTYGFWEVSIIPPPTSSLTIQASHDGFGGSHAPVERTFVTMGAPRITKPMEGTPQNPQFTLEGDQGAFGATVSIYPDLETGPVLGSSTITDMAGSWKVEVDVSPGRRSLAARQQFTGSPPSSASVARYFRIRPPRLGEVDVVVEGTVVTLSGEGIDDATVEFKVVSPPEATTPPPAEVIGGKFQTQVNGWPLGTVILDVVQKIRDVPAGWIESEPARITISLQLPDPAAIEHDQDYQPTISGMGYPGATVRLLGPDDTVAAEPVLVPTAGRWSTRTIAEWGPVRDREVRIRQFMDEHASPSWVTLKVTIRPRKPEIHPFDQDTLSPEFSGSCHSTATVLLKFSDDERFFEADVSGDTWRFQRDLFFTEGMAYAVQATQTLNGQTSEPASTSFMVYRERLKPAIRTPLPEQETDSDLTVTGDFGMSGASMRLWNLQDGKPLGDPVVLGQDGPWSVHLTGLAIKTWFITARQTLNDRASPDSEVRQFDVVVMPPEFVRPLPGGDLTRTAVLSGIGRRDGLVTVWRRGLDEPLLRDVQIGVDGTWEASVVLEVGDEILWATQTFEGKTSKPGLDVPCRVVPVAPTPESPTPEEFLGATVTVSGFGVPGDLITLKRGECVLGTAPVLDDASWSIPATLKLPDGAVTLSVMASRGEYHSVPSEWECQVRLFLPQFIYPGPGLWVPPLVAVTGLGKPGIGTLLSWYSADVLLAGPITVTDAGWTASPTEPLHSGAQWCRFRQISDTGAPMSDDAESARFDVRVDSPDNA